MLTTKDKELIEEAQRLVRFGDHNGVDALLRYAESEEAKKELRDLSSDAFLYEKLAFDCE